MQLSPVIIAVAGLVAPMVVLAHSRDPLRSPILLLASVYILGAVLHVAYWTLGVGRPPLRLLAGVDESVWVTASTILAIWMLITCIAYIAVPERQPSHRAVAPNYRLRSSYFAVTVVTTIISLLALVLVLRSSGVQSVGEFLARPVAKRRIDVIDGSGAIQTGALGSIRSFVAIVGPMAAVLFAAIRTSQVERTANTRAALLMLAATSILGSLVLGGRTEAALTGCVLAVVALWTNTSRIRLGKFAIWVGAFVLLVTTAGVWRAVGNQQRSERAVSSDEVVAEFISGRSWINPSVLAPVLDAVPASVDYQLGGTYLKVFIAPIPRGLWPDKPPVRVGPQFAESIFKLEGRVTGSPLGVVGESYLNFGYAGIAISAVGVGLGLAWIRNRVRRAALFSPFQVVALSYLLVAVAIRLPGGDFVGVAITTMRSVVIAAIASFLLLDRVRPKSSRAHRRHELPAVEPARLRRERISNA